MKVSIGELRDSVQLQSAGTAQDEIGEPLPVWVTVATVRASVKDVQSVNGRELLAAGGTQNLIRTKILIRHRADITEAMRVVCGANVYRIEEVLNMNGKRDWLMLMCSKGAPND